MDGYQTWSRCRHDALRAGIGFHAYMPGEMCSILCVYISPLRREQKRVPGRALLVNSVSAQGPVRTHRDL